MARSAFGRALFLPAGTAAAVLPARGGAAMVSAPRPGPPYMRDRLIRLLLRMLTALPFRAAQGLGAAIGWLHWLLPNRLKRTSRENIERCYAERDPAWRRRLLRANLIETGRTLAESVWILGRPPRHSLPLIREFNGMEHLERALRAGRGVLFATPHLGAWELSAVAAAERIPMTVLYRPARVAAFDELVSAARARLGLHPVPTNASGVRALHRALQRGEAVGMLPDQEPRSGQGVFAPFFGRPALTMTLVSRLAHRTGASVIIATTRRLPHGRGFSMRIWPADPHVADADPVVAATAVNHEVERAIALAPAQYMWNYKRFRTAPASTTNGTQA